MPLTGEGVNGKSNAKAQRRKRVWGLRDGFGESRLEGYELVDKILCWYENRQRVARMWGGDVADDKGKD